MGKPYSLDLRERLLQDYDDGMPVDDLVIQYRVSRSWLYSLLKQRRETGRIAPREYRRGRTKKLIPFEQEVRKIIADHPDGTLADFCERLSEHVSVSTATMCHYLQHLKITRKKRLSALPNNTAPMSLQNVPSGKNSKKFLM